MSIAFTQAGTLRRPFRAPAAVAAYLSAALIGARATLVVKPTR
jgi:hypothetical protein